jgi:hypothetical protein
MSIFGKLDAANIPSNPYYVEEGEYKAEVTGASFRTNSNNDRQLIIEYTITDDNSAFLDAKVTHFLNLPDPDLTAETLALLPPADQQKVRKQMANVKRTLCGNDANSRQKGLGVNEDDLNDDNWNPEVLKGTKVVVAVNNYGPKNENVSVRWVNLDEE